MRQKVVDVDCARDATGREGVTVCADDAMATTMEHACEGEALCHVDTRDEDCGLVQIVLIILATGSRSRRFRSEAVPKESYQGEHKVCR
jgi:hypothetical protein